MLGSSSPARTRRDSLAPQERLGFGGERFVTGGRRDRVARGAVSPLRVTEGREGARRAEVGTGLRSRGSQRLAEVHEGLRRDTEVEERFADEHAVRRRRRIELQRLERERETLLPACHAAVGFDLRPSLHFASERKEEAPEIHARSELERVVLDRSAVGADRVLGIAATLQGQPETEERLGIARVEGEAGAEPRDRRLHVSVVERDAPEQVARARQPRIARRGDLQRGARAGAVGHGESRRPDAVRRAAVRVADLRRSLECGERGCVSLGPIVRLPEGEPGLAMRGIEGSRRLEVRESACEIVGPRQQQTGSDPQRDILRAQCDRLLDGPCGAGKIAAPLPLRGLRDRIVGLRLLLERRREQREQQGGGEHPSEGGYRPRLSMPSTAEERLPLESDAARLPAPVVAAAVLSGAASLADEIGWLRLLTLEVGATAPALALLLATFFAGLALGSAIAGRLVERIARPRSAYVAIELAIGALGVASAPCLALAGGWLDAARPALALLLLPPTILMGATLPLLCRVVGAGGRRAARLYAWNTFGAALGTAAAGFLAIEWLGVRGTLWAAAAANVVAAALAATARPATPPRPIAEPSHAAAQATLPHRTILGLAFAVGAIAIAAEVALNRMLHQVLGGSTYAITATLVAFLLAIAAGSAMGARAFRGNADPRGRIRAGLLALGATCALAPRLLEVLASALRSGPDAALTVEGGLLLTALVAFAVLLPPALASGFLFPLLLRARRGPAATSLGVVYAVNTAGSIAASLGVTFLVVPALGLTRTLGAAALTAAALAAPGALRGRAAERLGLVAVLGLAALVLVPAPRPLRLWLYAPLAEARSDTERGEDRAASRTAEETILYREGVSTSVAVYATPAAAEPGKPPRRILDFAVNGKKEASTGFEAQRNQIVLGHLPMLLHPSPVRALVVGLGAGVTAGAVAVHPGVDVTVAEISPEVPEATRLFADWNHGVVDRANVRIVFEDGRRVLAAAGAGRFDVVTSDPIHPWVSGAASLYTEDYYRLVARALAPGGIAVHWLPLYEMAVEDSLTILRGFARALPESALWITWAGDAVLVGAKAPLRLDAQSFARRASAGDVGADLRSVGLGDPLRLLAGLAVGPRVADDPAVALHTDDHPILEFHAARNLFRRNTTADNLRFFAGHAWSADDLARFVGLQGATRPRLAALLRANVSTLRARGLVEREEPEAADAAIAAWVDEPDGEHLALLAGASGLARRVAESRTACDAFAAALLEVRAARRTGAGERLASARDRLRAARSLPDLDPDTDRAIARQLAVVLGELRDYAGTLDAVAPWIAEPAPDPTMLRIAALALARLGRDDEARAALERAAPLDLRGAPP